MSLVRDEILDQWVALSLAEYFGVGAPEASVERILRKARGETGERHPAESSGPTLQTAGPHRGLRLAVAAAVVAAAATVAFLLFNPPPEDADKNPVVACQGENPPENEVEFKDPTEEDTWVEKSTITHDEKSRVDVGPDSAILTRGSVRVKLEAGETYHVEAAGFVFTMHGPGQATVTLTPMRQMIGFMGQQDAGPQRSALAALSEVTSVLLLVRMHDGSAVLAQGEAIEELVAPATAQRMLYVVPDEEPWAEPLTLDELFHELDENGDGKLKPDEVSADFIARIDGDNDGELSTEELAKSDKLKPEYASQIIP
ncbi:MAG: hypothetical protein KDB29_15740, partial [Planctomycetes bacterium]|nr:hypothetical protein [Planctomycetota bacterium]